MKASSPKLNVLGVGEGDEYAFLGAVHPIFGEKLVGGSLLGRRKDGARSGQGEK